METNLAKDYLVNWKFQNQIRFHDSFWAMINITRQVMLNEILEYKVVTKPSILCKNFLIDL